MRPLDVHQGPIQVTRRTLRDAAIHRISPAEVAAIRKIRLPLAFPTSQPRSNRRKAQDQAQRVRGIMRRPSAGVASRSEQVSKLYEDVNNVVLAHLNQALETGKTINVPDWVSDVTEALADLVLHGAPTDEQPCVDRACSPADRSSHYGETGRWCRR